MNKFSHGGDVVLFSKEIKSKPQKIIDLSSNINFVKPKININFNDLKISSYPHYDRLYKALAKNYQVKKKQIELFNGGSSAIFSLFSFLKLTSCTIYSPAYLEYKKASENFGYKINLINRLKNMNSKVEKNSLAIFVNPSTPDGKYYKLKKLLKYWQKENCTVLIDESFLDFSQKKSAIKYLSNYNNLYILKSMTKFYSSAGIRVGLIISNEENIKNLRQKEPLWKISEFDSNYLQEALKDNKFKEKSIQKNKKIKKYLNKILTNSPLFEKIYKSNTNFIMAKLKNLTANEFQQELKKYKIMIRDCFNFDFLDNYFVRIAIKDKKKLKTLKNALKFF